MSLATCFLCIVFILVFSEHLLLFYCKNGTTVLVEEGNMISNTCTDQFVIKNFTMQFSSTRPRAELRHDTWSWCDQVLKHTRWHWCKLCTIVTWYIDEFNRAKEHCCTGKIRAMMDQEWHWQVEMPLQWTIEMKTFSPSSPQWRLMVISTVVHDDLIPCHCYR